MLVSFKISAILLLFRISSLLSLLSKSSNIEAVLGVVTASCAVTVFPVVQVPEAKSIRYISLQVRYMFASSEKVSG